MVHEFFGIRDGGVDEPDIEHQKEKDQEDCYPRPFSFQLIDPVVAVINMPCDECKKWNECDLNRYPCKAAIP